MSAEIVGLSGNVLTLRISGQLKHSELAECQEKAGEIILGVGRIRFLVLVEDFRGVEKAGDWGDISFAEQHDSAIEKIAFVGDPRWEELALLFAGKGVRRVPIEYFQTADLAKANAWLAAA